MDGLYLITLNYIVWRAKTETVIRVAPRNCQLDVEIARKEPGARSSKVPVTLRARNGIFKSKSKRIRARVLNSKPVHFVLLTDGFMMFSQKLLKPLSWTDVNKNSFWGPLIIGSFKKWPPGLRPRQNKPLWAIVTKSLVYIQSIKQYFFNGAFSSRGLKLAKIVRN